MKVVRLIIYEGSEKWLKTTLDHSLKDGINFLGGKVKVLTLGKLPELTDVIFVEEGGNHVL